MDRNSTVRWIVIAAIMLGAYWLFYGKKSSDHVQELPPETYVDAPGFAPDVIDVQPGRPTPPPPPPGEICTIHGNRFDAEMSSRGAGLTHFYLTDGRYAAARDVSTTPDHERWHNLRTEFRASPGDPPSPDDQVQYDRFDWRTEHLANGCRFTYEDA